MSTDPYREWDAAYVLGALAPDERRELEEHLAVCDACRAAVGELAGMPALLAHAAVDEPRTARAPASHPAPASPGAPASPAAAGSPAAPERVADVVPLADLARAAHRGRRRHRLGLVGAAAGLAVLAGVAGGALTAATDRTEVAADARSVTLAPVGGSGVSADVTMAPVRWGTRLEWSCAYAAAELPQGVYELVLVDADGGRSVVATWTSTGERTATGLGASSAVPLDGIARVELGVVGLDRPLAVGRVADA